MSRVLITGGLGFVGGRLSKRLSAEHDVIVSSRSKPVLSLLELHGGVKWVDHADLLNPNQFPAGIDQVIHLAALNEIECVRDPSSAIRVNVDETRIVLENAIAAGVRQFIYFSTAHIYGSPLAGTITEETLPVPAHPYAITHKAAEDFVVSAGLQKKIKSVVIRLSNSFGAPVAAEVNRWTLLANDLCRQAVEKGSMTLHSNGCQYRDFICLADVEEVIARMLPHGESLQHIIYNLGSGASVRVIDMANAIAAGCVTVMNKNIPVLLPAAAKMSEEPALHFSIDRIRKEGYELENNVEQELERLLKFCKKNFIYTA